MFSPESLGKVISADVLAVGGGIAGLTAAITAKETDPHLDVLVVDRITASAGWGTASRTAGILSFVTPDADPEDFIKYFVHNIGCFLNDQLLLSEFAYSGRQIVERAIRWGVSVAKGPDGKIQWVKGSFPWGTAIVDPDICVSMAKHAESLGIRFIDNVCVVDLLKDEEKISGAVGFSLLNGAYFIFKAKATILANGAQHYNVTLMWNGTGNGILAAYRAGAEMRNAEFGNMFDFARVDPQGWVYTGVHGGAHVIHDYLYNAKGENIGQKYWPGPRVIPDSPRVVLAWYKETLAGNGPIYADFETYEAARPIFECNVHPKVKARFGRIATKVNPPSDKKKVEVVPCIYGALSCVKVNHQMATSLPGLFAVGNVSGNGSARGGAAPTPPSQIHGTGIMNAFFTGIKGGASAAVYARALRDWKIEPEVDYEQADRFRQKIFEPLKRKGGISPWELIYEIQDALTPVDYSIVKSEERMKEALNNIAQAKAKLRELKANDYHELARCIDAESMVLCAEMFYKASLMRTETRGFHIREDYPEIDNKNWLKWIIVKKVNEEMTLYTEDVPIDKYPYKP
jgi:succinate dehydrogenase/fumarate reductase flavoprotein subunit